MRTTPSPKAAREMLSQFTLMRGDILNLDHALYCASCFSRSHPDGVTVMMMIDAGRRERYKIEDGKIEGPTINLPDAQWRPVYYLQAAPERT